MTNQEFAELMQQYQRLIYTVCLQFVHDPPTAEDLTQDTFLSAFTSIDRCDPAYRKQWLVRVAANKCKDHLKSAWVRRVEAQDHQSLPEPRGAPPAGSALTAPDPDPQDPLPAPGRRRRAGTDRARPARTLRPCGHPLLTGRQNRSPRSPACWGGRPRPCRTSFFRAKVLLRKLITERRQEPL